MALPPKILTGPGLQGGGDLSRTRTLSVKFGTGDGEVVEGNDPRLNGGGTNQAFAPGDLGQVLRWDGTQWAASNIIYTHHQSMPLTVWPIQHNLNAYPAVVVVDSAGSVGYSDVNYVDANYLEITHAAAFSGKALRYAYFT